MRELLKAIRKIKQEIELLRALESADRKADPTNCIKSLNQRTALEHLDEFRRASRKTKRGKE